MVNPILLLRITQGVLALIVLGIAAYVVDLYGGASDAANFLVFDSVWTFLALAYVVITPMFFPDFHNRWAVLGVEAITMVFWFAGFIAMAVNRIACLPGFSCGIPAAKAAAAFGAFEWLAWATSLALIVRALIQYGKAEPDVEAGTTPPTTDSGPFGSSAFNTADADVEPTGEQFDEDEDKFEEAPRLPELAELGGGGSDGGDGGTGGLYRGPTLEMPEVDHFVRR